MEEINDVGKFRRWFREAIDYWREWQTEAREDYEFVMGNQWSAEDKQRFAESRRPAIVINKIRPLINILSGYQRLNRFDIDFLPRTSDDSEICQVRKGMTKYILDRSDFNAEESNAFMDCAIAGLGWLEVTYEMKDEGGGEAKVARCDPFGMYVDPEAHRDDFSDAKYICRAKWVDKDELKLTYPEHADAIDEQVAIYDAAEPDLARDRHLWYQKEQSKVRLIECWFKQRKQQTQIMLSDGQQLDSNQLPPEQIQQLYSQGIITDIKSKVSVEVRIASFFDGVLLEEIESPYQHKEFPFVPITCQYFGIGGDEIPSGIVRDLKDPQREINRRRIQFLHILSTTGNGGGWIEEDAMDEKQFADFEKYGAVPGHFNKVKPMALSQGKIMERQIGQIPAGVIQAEANTTADLQSISGINEALMGTDIPHSVSGRAIELRQKQAITHLATLFDKLRRAKQKIAFLLWGESKRPGVIPQFYTADQVYRIEGTNGQQFVRVNQQVVQQDPVAGAVVSTLNDLSQGEFDIVVSDVEASTTQRQAQLWNLVDAIGKLGVPGDLVFDIVVDLSDIPNKEEVKQRWTQRQEQQAQAAQQQAQAQMELERIKNENLSQTISFKDAPLPIQLAMASKAGLIDPGLAQHAIEVMAQQMFPGYMEQQQAMQAQMQAQQQQQAMQAQMPPIQPESGGNNQQQQGNALTDAALKSLRDGMTPAV